MTNTPTRYLAWAIRHWDKGLYIDTVQPTRREAIVLFRAIYNMSEPHWQKDRKAGVHRPVRVEVSEFRS
jgi:hypothetical protein